MVEHKAQSFSSQWSIFVSVPLWWTLRPNFASSLKHTWISSKTSNGTTYDVLWWSTSNPWRNKILWSFLEFLPDRCVTTSSTKSPVPNGQMEQHAGQLGTQSLFKFLKMANPSGFGCHAKPYVGPTNDPAGSDTNRVNFVAQTPTAYVHMHPIGYTQNFGPFDGGCNMNSTQVLPPATHSTVTWLVCLLVQPTSHWPPCHTLTRPTTTNSDGMHRFRWHAQIQAPETYGDMIVTAPSRRANLHNEQPRRGRASTPRRHNTPKRHVTPPRPVVIRAEAPPAPTPAAPTHPWLTPETNWEEDPWTRAEREHAEKEEARAKVKAPPPPAPYSAQEPPAGPPVTPAINPPRQHRVEQTPITRAFETLRQTAGSSVQSIPASVPAPSPAPTSTELTQMTAPADANLMTQSWNLISGFPTTPSPPRIPDTILGAWFERPPIQFTRQLPPTHPGGRVLILINIAKKILISIVFQYRVLIFQALKSIKNSIKKASKSQPKNNTGTAAKMQVVFQIACLWSVGVGNYFVDSCLYMLYTCQNLSHNGPLAKDQWSHHFSFM